MSAHTAESVRRELRGAVFQLGPDGPWEVRERYCSGDVVGKLEEARRWAGVDPAFEENVAALGACQPERVGIAEIVVPFGAPWVGAETYVAFLRHLFPAFDGYGAELAYVAETATWVLEVSNKYLLGSVENTRTYGTGRVSAIDLVECGLRLQVPAVYDEVSDGAGGVRQVRNEAESALAGAKLAEIRERWAAWLPRDAERAKRLEDEYNRRYNRVAPRKYDGSRLTFPGLSLTFQGQPFALRPHQAAGAQRILERGERDDTCMLAYYPGAGKAQPLEAKVLTPDGWTTMGEVRVGDGVIAGDGSVTTVTGVFPQGVKEVFRVTFSDGSSTECCDEHLWKVRNSFQRASSYCAGKRDVWKVLPLSTIKHKLDYFGKKNYDIPVMPSAEFYEQPVPIDPYLLGVLIGDGSMAGCKSVGFASADEEIVTSVRRLIPVGCQVKYVSKYDYRISRTAISGSNPLLSALREVGLSGKKSQNKHIPDCYLFNSQEIRASVLQGLMDTDGTVSPRSGSISFCTTSPRLVEGVRFIVRSLGGTCSMSWVTKKYTHKGEKRTGLPAAVMQIKLPNDVLPFRLSRKAALVRPKSRYLPKRYITDVQPIGVKICQCIAVMHQSHTYVTDDFIVTHNTAAAIVGIVKRLQLGLTRKAVVVVPKSVIGQWASTFLGLYPGHAEWLLVGTDRAYEARNRRAFLTTAALGDARVVLLSYEQFRAVTLRPETFGAYLRREVQDLERAMLEVGERDLGKKNLERSFKQRQKSLANFEAKYADKWEKVRVAGDADVSWEMWDCDLLCTDEAHMAKNDIVVTKMTGVSGLPRGESQRAFDMRVKLHYVTTPELFPDLARPNGEALRGGKGVFLTGTPVTNSLVETWIMMRHLQPRLLRDLGLWQFDAWAATFTTQQQVPEMDAVGAWRTRTRLKFHNLPELQDLLGLCWDRVDPATVLGTRPSIVGGRMRVVETTGSDDLREYTRDLAERAEAVKGRKVDPHEDNMLKITHDGRCASVFNGRPATEWPVERVTKLDAVAREVWELYCHSDDADGVQLVFVDLFTPKADSGYDSSEDTRSRGDNATSRKLRALAASTHSAHEASSAVSEAARLEAQRVGLTAEELFLQRGVYGVLRDKLVAAGCLGREVAYIHDAATDAERAELFARANAGAIRVLIGSTQKMGLGVNVQRRAFGAHHVTVPWRPDWLDQANKRVDRDGNTMDAVHLVCYPTTFSFDVVLWQMIATKGEFVSQINSGTYAGRSADDIGDLVIDATTAQAVALGDLRVIEKVKLELELVQLSRQFKLWKAEHLFARRELESLPRRCEERDREVAELRELIAHRNANQVKSWQVKLRPAMSGGLGDGPPSWQVMTDRSLADGRVHVLAESLRHKLGSDGLLVGQYRGLDLLLVRDGGGVHLEARHGADGAEVVAKNVGVRGGVGAFAVLESSLAGLETAVHRLTTQADIARGRLEALRAEAPAWAHAERAAALCARYDELCAAVATAGIVDRQSFKFE